MGPDPSDPKMGRVWVWTQNFVSDGSGSLDPDPDPKPTILVGPIV